MSVRARHVHLDHEVVLLRRVFGETPQQAHRLVCLLLLTGGWRGVVSVLDVLPDAQHEAPWLDVASDLLPPPRPAAAVARMRSSCACTSQPDRPYLGHAAGSPEATRDAGSTQDKASASFVVPEASHEASQALRGLVGGQPARPASDRGTPPNAGTRSRSYRARRAWLAEVCQPWAEAVCGWLVDRYTPSQRAQLLPPLRDPLPSGAGWPAALAFGPDMLATDTDIDEADHDALITRGTDGERRWHRSLPW